jgi:hypothetical protein
MSAAEQLAGLLGSGVELALEGDRVRLREPRPGLLRPEHRPAILACSLLLLALASGRWRTEISTWTEDRRHAWAKQAAILTFDGGLAVERSERVAYLEAAALPPPPAPPPEAPCCACGTFDSAIASGLGSCPGCGAVPRLAWPWS